MKLIPLPAFQPNDPWHLPNRGLVLAAAPGDAHSVLACLQRDRLQLGAILVTHHAAGHTGHEDSPASPAEPHNAELVHSLQRK